MDWAFVSLRLLGSRRNRAVISQSGVHSRLLRVPQVILAIGYTDLQYTYFETATKDTGSPVEVLRIRYYGGRHKAIVLVPDGVRVSHPQSDR